MPSLLVGDLVQYNDRRWRVIERDQRVRVSKLSTWEGEVIELADNTEGLEFVARPQQQWPFTTIKRSLSPLVSVSRSGTVLVPLVDWIPSAVGSGGGSIFFSPALHLRQGEVLVGHHASGSLSRINITRAFGTIRRRLAREQTAPLRTDGERIRDGEDFFREGFDE